MCSLAWLAVLGSKRHLPFWTDSQGRFQRRIPEGKYNVLLYMNTVGLKTSLSKEYQSGSTPMCSLLTQFEDPRKLGLLLEA